MLFTASWCAPCKQVKALCDSRVEIIDVEENSEIVEKYQIRALPTMIIEIDGKEVKRFVGNFGGRKDYFDAFINIDEDDNK